MAPLRYLPDVIDQMIAVIPSTEKAFIASLEDNKDSALFSSPETTRLRWEVTGETLYQYIGNGDSLEEWQKKVVDVWMNRSPTKVPQ